MAATSRHALALLWLAALPASAAVLPEDRADALYHAYDGGGVEISGPSILVRKQVGQSVSLSGNYYVDSISGASIDVIVSGASPYKEERTERRVGVDYLRGKTLMSAGYSRSEENDFTATTANVGISQTFFGDLTTLSLGYSQGEDQVGKTGQADFEEQADRRSFRVGLSQVMTKNLLLDLGWETMADEGFLNNPYRSVRYLDPLNAKGYSFQAEVYPRTHTTNALALRSLYYLPRRAALQAEYRYFSDTWGIAGHTASLSYTQPWQDWIFDLRYRYYTQTAADFYADLFPYADAQTHLARDKELSTFHDYAVGFGASYEFTRNWHFVDRGTVNLRYDHIQFDYENFRDLTTQATPGEEPLYSFSADVIQLFVSFWY